MAKTTKRSKPVPKRTGKKPAARAARTMRATPRRQRLPEMEDSAIAELDKVAVEYATIRDDRIALNAEEVTLKQRALQAMKKHGRTVYRHAGISIVLTPGEESIKVSVAKEKAEDDHAGSDETHDASRVVVDNEDDDREDGGDEPEPEPEPEAEDVDGADGTL